MDYLRQSQWEGQRGTPMSHHPQLKNCISTIVLIFFPPFPVESSVCPKHALSEVSKPGCHLLSHHLSQPSPRDPRQIIKYTAQENLCIHWGLALSNPTDFCSFIPQICQNVQGRYGIVDLREPKDAIGCWLRVYSSSPEGLTATWLRQACLLEPSRVFWGTHSRVTGRSRGSWRGMLAHSLSAGLA